MARIICAVALVILASTQYAMSDGTTTAPAAKEPQVLPSPAEFWKDALHNNLTSLKWAHAVNNKTLLDKALASDIHMIEADVSLIDSVPKMAHASNETTDLTLEQFIETVLKNKTKGIKLDFKSTEAFNGSIPILKKFKRNMTTPVFINADIVQGPLNAGEPGVEPVNFLKQAMDVIPESTLSIGWTTKYGKDYNITKAAYTADQISNMLKIVNKSDKKNQSITYAVRAGIVANQTLEMKKLLNETTAKNSTLTIWSHKGDEVDVPALTELIKTIGLHRVYIDLPEDLMAKLNLSSGCSNVVMSALALSTCFFAIFLGK